MHYKKILSLLLLLFSIILVVRLCFHTKENTNDSTNIVSQKQTDTLSDNSIMQNESTHILSENTIFEEEQEVIMIHPDRVSYQDNFYYEPITEEVKERCSSIPRR